MNVIQSIWGNMMKQKTKAEKHPPANKLHIEASPINHCYFIVDDEQNVIKIVRDEKKALSFIRTLH